MWSSILEDFDGVGETIGAYLPSLLAALAILVIGWIVARIVASLVRKALDRTSLDNRIASWVTGQEGGQDVHVEKWVSRGVFYLLMLFVLVAFFQVMGLPAITEPLNRFLVTVFEFLPRLLGPALLALLAWVLASTLRFLVRRLLESSNLDRKLSETANLGEKEAGQETKVIPLSKTLSETVYWVIWLLFLPAILGPLGLEGILAPIQNLVDELLGYLPQILAAGLILAIGWLVARIIQRIVTSLLSAVGIDGFAEQVGVARALGKQRLSALVGTIVYFLILIPVLIASLDALQIEAITRPASDMLNTILAAIPNIFAAFLILAIAYVVGRIVSGLVANILASIGFDAVLGKVGITRESTEGELKPSGLVGTLTLLAILVLAVSEASEILGFALVSELVGQFVVFAGQIVLGIVILGIGLYLANLAASAIRNSRASEAPLLSLAARIAIIVLAAAMALRQMGLANEIIELAFGLTVGAVAVAVALAFGLGSRDAAARQVEGWQKKLKSRADSSPRE